MNKNSKSKTLAQQADRHDLYQKSVQDVHGEISFVLETWDALRARPAELLREDFCGTGNTSCEWVKRKESHCAIGIDLDKEVLAWGKRKNIANLTREQQGRIELRLGDDDVLLELSDIVLAMNFSYWLFRTRKELKAYFQSVCEGLVDDGILFLDAYGGYDAPRELEERRKCNGFVYIWDQSHFNPVDSHMICNIHFEFDDGSRIDKAFTYHWRLWTLPEIKELLIEAGFSKVDIYWEVATAENEEESSAYAVQDIADADAGWVCYIVAQKMHYT